MNKENLYIKPINLIINEINQAQNNGIFLIGEEGSGKTATLLEYVEVSKKTTKPVIDATLMSIFPLELYNDFAKLYQVCNVLQKMLLYIKENYLRCYVEHFLIFNTKILNIQNDILIMYNLNKYNLDRPSIDKNILNNPEILIEEFLNIAIKYLKYESLTIVLDNFDIEKPYMYLYQTYMYNMLKKYLKVVATISDPTIINNQDKLNQLSKENSLIIIDYTKKVDILKKILDNYFATIQNKKIISKRVSFMFSDDTIKELIVKTNGNLRLMILAVKIFFASINEMSPMDYNNYLLNLVENNLNNILISDIRIRKLYL